MNPEITVAEAKADRNAERREEILDAATKLFAEHGYADTDTQQLADKLGVGKGTLVKRLIAEHPELEFALSISATTRAPRPGEEDGVHYRF